MFSVSTKTLTNCRSVYFHSENAPHTGVKKADKDIKIRFPLIDSETKL